MKLSILFILLVLSFGAFSGPIDCVVESDSSISIRMDTPHPEDALIYRPNGETVWLQMEGEFLHKQIENFESLEHWKLTSESQGTVYNNGEPTIQKIINGNGKYHLYIAKNTETERENTEFIECYFSIDFF